LRKDAIGLTQNFVTAEEILDGEADVESGLCNQFIQGPFEGMLARKIGGRRLGSGYQGKKDGDWKGRFHGRSHCGPA
jgi:hypothetical protein